MEYTIVAKPDGTIEVVPVEQVNNLPFNVGERLFNEFNTATSVPNLTNQPYLSPTYLMKQQLGMVPTGITASSAAVPFGTDVDRGQGFTEGSQSDESFLLKPLRYDKDNNFYMMDPTINNQTADEKEEESGLAKLLEFLAPGSLLSKVLPQESPEIRSMKNFYRRNYGLTPTGQVASGIMAGYNPVSGGLLNMLTSGKYGRPTNLGLAGAMQRRIENILGRRAPQTDASRAKVAELRDLQLREMKDRADRGESLSSIGKSTFSGPGMAFEQKGGGFSVKSDGSKRFYGGR